MACSNVAVGSELGHSAAQTRWVVRYESKSAGFWIK